MAIYRQVIVVSVSTAFFLSGAARAFAHAQLIHAEPPPGSAVSTAPSEVTLNFSERLEPAFSSVVVRDAVGNRVDKANAYVDKNRAVMRISLQSLAPGVYIVEWRAVATGTHRTEGAFIFHVGE
jgi:methionine-rich copper-binding protein CopC